MKELGIMQLLHKVKLYRENIIYRENNNGLISLQERHELDNEIKRLATIIDNSIYKFKELDCKECCNYKKCLKIGQADINCFTLYE
jgi:hypothetical protein